MLQFGKLAVNSFKRGVLPKFHALVTHKPTLDDFVSHVPECGKLPFPGDLGRIIESPMDGLGAWRFIIFTVTIF